jgi:hypothetical protein
MATVKAKPAAGPNPRHHHSPESRAKMSAAQKGREVSPEDPRQDLSRPEGPAGASAESRDPGQDRRGPEGPAGASAQS